MSLGVCAKVWQLCWKNEKRKKSAPETHKLLNRMYIETYKRLIYSFLMKINEDLFSFDLHHDHNNHAPATTIFFLNILTIISIDP